MNEHDDGLATLRPKLTDEFLSTLVEASEVTMFDYIEINGFVRELFQIAGKEIPESHQTRSISEE